MNTTGFDSARFRRSLTPDAPIADQCAAMIAIRQAALNAKSTVGRKLLRDLQLSAFGN